MGVPSTAWREVIPDGEPARLEAFARAIGELQRTLSERFGPGRAFHRKPVGALRASLTVGELPEVVRQGLFAAPGRHDVWVRLSNGSVRPQRNSTADIRGFALSIRGVAGESALGGPASSQDFLLINREVFGFRDVGPFVDLAVAASRGPLAVLWLFVRTYGFFAGLSEVRRLTSSLGRPFSGFLTEPFFSGVPVKWGPYAARLRLQPEQAPRADSAPDLADEVWARLAHGPARMALQVQLFVDERVTPIEDASANWDEVDAPYHTVGTLELPAQAPDAAFTAEVEAAAFDPWHALADHRPLGHVMRARKAAYFTSQQNRSR
ncbi:MAG: catalase [Myxococcota bacterium]